MGIQRLKPQVSKTKEPYDMVVTGLTAANSTVPTEILNIVGACYVEGFIFRSATGVPKITLVEDGVTTVFNYISGTFVNNLYLPVERFYKTSFKVIAENGIGSGGGSVYVTVLYKLI